jgi:hypothetical protein
MARPGKSRSESTRTGGPAAISQFFLFAGVGRRQYDSFFRLSSPFKNEPMNMANYRSDGITVTSPATSVH